MDPGRCSGRALRPVPRPAPCRAAAARHDLRLRACRRAEQTFGADGEPLAARLGLVVIARFAAGQERDLAREISGRPGVTLVAWHHEAIHEIAHNLGKVEPTPPGHWPHDRFDVIWTFTPDQDGWRFAQVPQLLLPGDLAYPITTLVGSTSQGSREQ